MFFQRPDALADEHGVVLHDVDLHAWREARDDVGPEPVHDPLHDRDGIGVRDLHRAQSDRGLAIEPRELPEVGEPVLDLGDVLEPDRRSVAEPDDHLLEIVHVVELEVELHQVLGRAADDESARDLQVLAGERVLNVLRRDAERRHAGGQQVHADGAVAPAADAYFADAVDRLELLLDDVDRVLVQLLLGAIARDRHPEDRRGVGLDLRDYRRVGVLRQAAQHLVHLRLHLVERDVDALVEVESDVDLRHAGRGRRLDVLDARHAVHRALDHAGDRGVDDVGVRALHSGLDRDHRKLDVRQLVHADALVRDEAEQHEHRVQHHGEDMALDRELGQRHAGTFRIVRTRRPSRPGRSASPGPAAPRWAPPGLAPGRTSRRAAWTP